MSNSISIELMYFILSLIVGFTFPLNSRMGDTRCLIITVTNDNVYQTSPVLMETVTLSKMNGQGRLNLTNTETIVTVNDDDGETVIY